MTDAKVALTDCDREPIHIPGTIQPYGMLFVLAEPALTVAQVSENVSDHLSLGVDAIIGRPLSEIVDPAGAEEVRSVLREQRWHDANPLSIGACGKRFDEMRVVLHPSLGRQASSFRHGKGPPRRASSTPPRRSSAVQT